MIEFISIMVVFFSGWFVGKERTLRKIFSSLEKRMAKIKADPTLTYEETNREVIGIRGALEIIEEAIK